MTRIIRTATEKKAIAKLATPTSEQNSRLTGISEQSGAFYVCNGYAALKLLEDVEEIERAGANYPDLARIMGDIPTDAEEIALPSVEQLKRYIAAKKAEHKAKKDAGLIGKNEPLSIYACLIDREQITNGYTVDAELLLTVLKALPGLRAFRPASYVSPMHLINDDGERAYICPCKVPAELTKTDPALWAPVEKVEKVRKISLTADELEKIRTEAYNAGYAAAISEAKTETAKAAPEQIEQPEPSEQPGQPESINENGDGTKTVYSADGIHKTEIEQTAADCYNVREFEKMGERWVELGSSENWSGELVREYFGDEIEQQPEPAEQPAEQPAKQEEPKTEQPRTETEDKKTMLDKNGNEIRKGDVVTVSGGYAKNNNGLFFVTDAGEKSLWLKKLNKNGTLSESDYSTQQFPPSCHVSDYSKRAAAREQNAKATVERIGGINTYYVAEYFRKIESDYRAAAERCRERGWSENEITKHEQTATEAAAAAERAEQTANQPEEKEPEKGLKFYYNGIKIDGGKLIKCWYSEGDESVTVYADSYGSALPAQYFEIVNESDCMTDYFETDRAKLTPAHPLYKYALYYARLSQIKRLEKKIEHDKKRAGTAQASSKKYYESEIKSDTAKLAELREQIKNDPGQPTEKNLTEIKEMRIVEQNAARAREQAREAKEREKMLKERTEGRILIEQTAAEHPIKDGEPVVKIEWSEYPALERGAELSIAAAEIILKTFDEKQPEHSGYYKTGFTIRYTDPNTGEPSTHSGRYDLGDHDGGLIEHIRSIGAWERTHNDRTGAKIPNAPAEKNDLERLADHLERYTEGGHIEKITPAPWLIEYAKAKREQSRQDFADILAQVEMLTNEQIIEIIKSISPNDNEKLDVARFFLQELQRRDKRLALETFEKWKSGDTL